MSKKSRKRNKKILSALLLGGLGLAAANKRKARDVSIEANEAKESGFDIPAVVTTPKNKPSKRKDSVLASPVINKMDTSEVDIPDNYFKQPSRIKRKPITFGSGNDGLSYFKKGRRVKGCGIAKKGLGRAMKKGKK